MRIRNLVAGLAMAATVGLTPAPAVAQGSDPYLGQLTLFPYTFCPRGWLEANGALLSIAQYTALFSLVGTTYGGDGRTTFGLPDLRGRVPISQGTGPGLSTYSLGQQGGTENTTLNLSNIPAHTHTATATTLIKLAANATADSPTPLRNSFAPTGGPNIYYSGAPTTNYMNANTAQTTVTVAPAGGGLPFSTLQPYLTLQWCIATQGIFPSRN